MTTPLDYGPPPGRRSSAAGAASLGLGVATLLAYFLLLSTQRRGGAPDPPAWEAVAVFATLVGLPAVGLALGVFSLRTPARRRGPAIAGVILNGPLLALPLIGIAVYLLVGIR